MSPAPGTVLRTLLHLRPGQLVHQVRDTLRGPPRPAPEPAVPPELAVRAAPAPFPGAPAHARLLGPGRVALLNRTLDSGDRIDWAFAGEGPLFAFHLHQHDFLRDPDLASEQRAGVILDWIERHRIGTGWHPAPISLRALTWLRLLATPGALALTDADAGRVRASLAAQLDTLARHLELRLLANHYLSNLLALVAGGVAFEGTAADAWLGHRTALLEQLDEQVPADGAHFERSPMYHALMLENVLDLLNLSRASGRGGAALDAALGDAAARMLGALEVFTHPDGEIALFADSALGIAQPPAALEAYAASLEVEVRPPVVPGVLGDAGYVRLEAGPWSLLASVAGPAPEYQPGHAHADALSFELCLDGHRLVTDTGVFEYIAGERRDRSRATTSHATLEVDGRDQAELWAAHRVGGRPRVCLCRVEPGHRAEATCEGWASRGSVHRRVLEVSPEGLRIVDTLEGRVRPSKLVLPVVAGVDVDLRGSEAVLGACRVKLPADAAFRVESGAAYVEFGRSEIRSVLVGCASGPGPFVWEFRRA